MTRRQVLSSGPLRWPFMSPATPLTSWLVGDRCSERMHGGMCRLGMRKNDLHLVCGAVLPIW